MPSEACVHIVDDDQTIRRQLAFFVADAGYATRLYESAEAFLEAAPRSAPGCVVTDLRMPGMSGVQLVKALREAGVEHPVIVISGHADVLLAVEAMKAGAVDFLQKPFRTAALVDAIRLALERDAAHAPMAEAVAAFRAAVSTLSPRQREVLIGIVAGKLNKTVAHELGISVRTLEGYRAEVLARTQVRNSSELVKLGALSGL
jgi:two-component system response regulator FixJ